MKAIKLALTGLLTLATFATAHRGEKANDGVNLPQPGGIHWDNKMFTQVVHACTTDMSPANIIQLPLQG